VDGVGGYLRTPNVTVMMTIGTDCATVKYMALYTADWRMARSSLSRELPILSAKLASQFMNLMMRIPDITSCVCLTRSSVCFRIPVRPAHASSHRLAGEESCPHARGTTLGMGRAVVRLCASAAGRTLLKCAQLADECACDGDKHHNGTQPRQCRDRAEHVHDQCECDAEAQGDHPQVVENPHDPARTLHILQNARAVWPQHPARCAMSPPRPAPLGARHRGTAGNSGSGGNHSTCDIMLVILPWE
jgi:hypothetical protein